MIIACPACATRYVVPDSAIGSEGRTVRCAKCKHSWYQDGPELAASAAPVVPESARQGVVATEPRPNATPASGVASPAPVAAGTPAPAASPQESRESGVQSWSDRDIRAEWGDEAENAADEGLDGTGPEPLPEADGTEAGAVIVEAEEDMPPPVDWAGRIHADEAEAYEDVSQFDHEPPFRPRRNWLRWLTWIAGAFAAIALAALLAMQFFGLPSWLPIDRPMYGADPGLKVEFPASEQERRTLPNGSEFFGARVVIRNDTRETKTVPPLVIKLLDARERIVYSWELVPPQRTLAPGEEQTINEAMTDVPKSAVYADIGWAPR